MKKDNSDIYILAIESSCDDTSAAVLCNNKVLSNVVSSQAIHAEFGGVVPELASREHQKHIIPVVGTALKRAGVSKSALHGIAYTRGPGLLGSLLVGSSFAKSMSLTLGIPLIEVNHMEGHILAHWIDDESPIPAFPLLNLTVSGGHTQIVKVDSPSSFQVLGQTIDDAAGEAFDKSAKMLGLPYPGGPLIDKHAKQGNPHRFTFSKPKVGGLDFSFSGLKTAILYFLQKELKNNPNFISEHLDDLCASIQHTIIDVLMQKLELAVKQTGIKHVGLAGGVSANSGLRKELETLGEAQGWHIYIPKFEYCTDNAAMIGIVGYYKYLERDFSNLSAAPKSRMTI